MGYLVDFTTSQTAENELASFSFNMIVVNELYIPIPVNKYYEEKATIKAQK